MAREIFIAKKRGIETFFCALRLESITLLYNITCKKAELFEKIGIKEDDEQNLIQERKLH